MVARGKMQHRVALDAPDDTADGAGGVVHGWAQRQVLWAHVLWLRGGETVQAARLKGRQPAVVTLDRTAVSGAADTRWRLRMLDMVPPGGSDEAFPGLVFAIRAIVPTDDRRQLEITCEAGARARASGAGL